MGTLSRHTPCPSSFPLVSCCELAHRSQFGNELPYSHDKRTCRPLGTINSLKDIASSNVILECTVLGLLALVPIAYRTFTEKPPNQGLMPRSNLTHDHASMPSHQPKGPRS